VSEFIPLCQTEIIALSLPPELVYEINEDDEGRRLKEKRASPSSSEETS